jgi:Carbohydrate family 9 binding domain-like
MSQSASVAESKHAPHDVAADTNPHSEFWRAAPAIIADRDPFGNIVPGHRTEVRSRWTNNNIYFLFICPYQELYLNPHPRTDVETNQLWNWDVAEVFVGSDFQNIRKYREFEVSPQGEWIDLDIDLDKPHHEDGWRWNSGFKVAARVDDRLKVWYACMRIPYSSVDTKPASPGNTLRVNFYRAQGPPSHHQAIAWQPTHQATYHVPEAFGILKLVE